MDCEVRHFYLRRQPSRAGPHADAAGNLIDHNSRDGISVSINSNVTLGDTTEGGLFSPVNNTTAGSENINFGVRCSVNSSVFAKLGSLKIGHVEPDAVQDFESHGTPPLRASLTKLTGAS
jgi:hypothetical protein